jgi:hypothetical protein
MGINLCLETLDGRAHPSWNDSKWSGVRDLLRMIDELPTESRLNGNGDVWQGAEPVWRPIDHAAFRAALLKRFDFNHDVWNRLADILESEPEYWMYFSI